MTSTLREQSEAWLGWAGLAGLGGENKDKVR